jgi:hypothetical protein
MPAAGYETGLVDYKRKPANLKIETDIELAKRHLYLSYSGILNPEKTLTVLANYFPDTVSPGVFISSHQQELAYLLEFTQHHMALIKTRLEATVSIILPQGFGKAAHKIASGRLRQQ